MNRNLRTAAAALLMAAAVVSARGMFMNRSVKVPVDRAVANVEKWVKDKPGDAQGYYVLGRLHAMAWAYGPELNLWRPMPARPEGAGRRVAGPDEEAAPGADPFNGELPGFGPYDAVQVRRDPKKREISEADAGHLRDAVRNYRKAVELDPKSPIFELGLAWLLQETGKAAGQLPLESMDLTAAKATDTERAAYSAAIEKLGDADPQVRTAATETLEKEMPKPLEQLRAVKSTDDEVKARVERIIRGYFDLQALEHYRKAYDLSIKDDLAKPGGLMRANAVISSEAGEAILQILTDRPGAGRPNEERDVGEALK
jgi:tetratricopeptide (TPR) repeat protein